MPVSRKYYICHYAAVLQNKELKGFFMTDQVWLPQNRESLSPRILKNAHYVLERIPQLPLSVQKIIEMARDDNVDSNQLAEVASSDPVLVSKILMMVNSTYYGLTHKVDDLRLAIVLLGFNEVRNIAVQFGIMNALGQDVEEGVYDTKKLWRHSYLVSVCAEMMSGDDNPKLAGVLMTMGILHDIGKFALNSIAELIEKKTGKKAGNLEIPDDKPLLAKEENIFGLNHAIIGSMLAEKWNLSKRMCDVIEYHHFPSFFGINDIKSKYIEDISALCFADLIANIIKEEKKGLREPHPVFFETLGIKPPLENLITEEIRTKLSKAEEVIENQL